MRISGIVHNTKQVIKGLDSFKDKDMPYVMMLTANNLAFDSMDSLKKEVRGSLRLNNKRMANAWRVKKATKSKPYAEVYVDEFSWPFKALAHHYKGGDRERKGMEKAMVYMGLMHKGEILTPSPGVKIRSYVYVEMMAQLKLNYKAGFNSNETKSSRARRERMRGKGVRYFVITGKSTSPMAPGVYARIPGNDSPVCMLRIAERPSYSKRMDSMATIKKVYARRKDKHFSDAMTRAMAIRKAKGWS